VELKIANHAIVSCQVDIIDNAYKKAPLSKTVAALGHVSILLDIKSSLRWYDFTVRVKGNSTFFRRYAGRVETGDTDGYSDPAMA
jgi:phospholipase C